ncbi:MAG TPA: amino acid adenylation domain-containing protein, partial [Thermoanaerobaculia bacterium]|nr:amino acid adenylation domain-containing protein [Thermoanaerobaculia bacterium]
AIDRAPLMRFAIIDDETAVWTYHAALLDGRSVNLILTESADDREFREYVEWLAQQDLGAAEAYWRGKLKGFTAPTPLPHARPSGQGIGSVPVAAANVLPTWSKLLALYSGEADVVFGVAESRRPPGFENTLGMFINTVPVRGGDFDVEHAHASLASIQRWAEVHPLFESIVILDEKPVRGRLHEHSTYPLAITRDSLLYDRSRIDDDTAQRIAGHLENGGAITGGESEQLLVGWNATKRDYDLDRCVHELFEAQAARTPDRIAVTFKGTSITYRELDERANDIAKALPPNALIGIQLDRSLDLVATLLAVWKAGSAYVPLDPMFPKDRIEFMIEDSKAALVIDRATLDKLTGNRQPATGNQPSASDLAYVLYTSGSTGKPKGVQIPHRAVVNFLDTMREQPGLTEDDVLLAVTTLSFDIAGLELYLPLTTGARIELVSRETAADGRALAEVLKGATIMQATPATWRMLLEAGWEGDPKLKILCGGEAMSADLAETLLDRCGSLWNMYGPTETTIWSTVEQVERADRDVRGATVPIGKPIANTTVYVLDKELQPVPIGVAGELHIGGAGVARGYLNRPELTAERFIDDPFVPNARVYKTGDAVRWLADGRLEYLNRLDNQVKVRGYRIELGEIESALRKHPSIKDAVVIVRNQVLAAYVIGSATSQELREFLRASLPEYMIPSFFIALDAFPLTPNGKVDRKALPEVDHASRESEDAFVAPRDALETQLAKIWCDVLKIPAASVHDNFFEHGGESILALRMFVRIEQELGQKLPLATLIQANTIEALANALRGSEKFEAPWSPLVAIQPRGQKRPFFAVHGVGGNVINYRALARHLGDDQPFYALQARGLDRRENPLTTINAMARLYIDEIRRVQPHGPYLLGGLSFGGIVAFEMAQQLRDAGEETALVALFDTQPVGYHSLLEIADTTLRTRMRTHLDVVLRGPNRIRYVLRRVRRIWRRAVYKSWQTTFRVFEKLQRPLPVSLRDVQQANYLALRKYKPRLYAGEVAFFYAEKEPEGFTREKQEGWALLAEGGVISEKVGGDHLTMLDEPHVRVLAERLEARLDAASGQLTSQPFTRTLRPWPATSSAS